MFSGKKNVLCPLRYNNGVVNYFDNKIFPDQCFATKKYLFYLMDIVIFVYRAKFVFAIPVVFVYMFY